MTCNHEIEIHQEPNTGTATPAQEITLNPEAVQDLVQERYLSNLLATTLNSLEPAITSLEGKELAAYALRIYRTHRRDTGG